jgi:hypothetical protein
MKLWSEFYDFTLPDLPGCPVAAIDIALRQSAIEFCEQSLAWKAEHDPVAVVSGTAEYAFVPPSESVVHAITYAAFDDTELQITGETGILIQSWRTGTGTPKYILGGATALTLVPEPDIDGTLTMTVALKPSPDAFGIDDSIFNEFRQVIIHGALSKLMLSPKKPYSDPQFATYHAQQFTIKTGAAGTRSDRNNTRMPLRTAILSRGS